MFHLLKKTHEEEHVFDELQTNGRVYKGEENGLAAAVFVNIRVLYKSNCLLFELIKGRKTINIFNLH